MAAPPAPDAAALIADAAELDAASPLRTAPIRGIPTDVGALISRRTETVRGPFGDRTISCPLGGAPGAVVVGLSVEIHIRSPHSPGELVEKIRVCAGTLIVHELSGETAPWAYSGADGRLFLSVALAEVVTEPHPLLCPGDADFSVEVVARDAAPITKVAVREHLRAYDMGSLEAKLAGQWFPMLQTGSGSAPLRRRGDRVEADLYLGTLASRLTFRWASGKRRRFQICLVRHPDDERYLPWKTVEGAGTVGLTVPLCEIALDRAACLPAHRIYRVVLVADTLESDRESDDTSKDKIYYSYRSWNLLGFARAADIGGKYAPATDKPLVGMLRSL